MKPLKKAIRFFEKYGIEGADQMLFDLFLEWKKEDEPNVKMERAVYLSVCDVRQYLANVAFIVESGKSASVSFHLLPNLDLSLLGIIGKELKRKKRLSEFISDLEGLKIVLWR